MNVRKVQVAILARLPREMSQTDRILPRYILSRVRVSFRPRIFYTRKNRKPQSPGPPQSITALRQINNVVRQGGILSPYLFNVYMDDLSQSLNCCKTGCWSGEIMINHFMYADNLVLLSPSATGLRELLLACEKYSKEHAIIYNSKKSSVLICKNRATLHVPSLPSMV